MSELQNTLQSVEPKEARSIRFTVPLSETEYSKVRDAAWMMDTNKTELIRRALASYFIKIGISEGGNNG